MILFCCLLPFLQNARPKFVQKKKKNNNKKKQNNNRSFRPSRKALIIIKKENNNRSFRPSRKALIKKKKPKNNNKVFRWKRKTLIINVPFIVCIFSYNNSTVVSFCTNCVFCGEDLVSCQNLRRTICIIYNKICSNQICWKSTLHVGWSFLISIS